MPVSTISCKATEQTEPHLIPTMLQRYVLREMLRVALLSALALTAIIFVGMSVSRVQQGLNVVQLRGLIPYIAAFSLPYALPTALLVASVFVFGRLSGANELTAVASSGSPRASR